MNFSEVCLKCAEEGIVLLRNDAKLLPFHSGDRVSVFGRCQKDWYRSGTGSGGSVHCEYTTKLIDSLVELGKEMDSALIDSELLVRYEDWLKSHPFDNGGNLWAAEPYSQQEMELSETLVHASAKLSNKALFVIGRNTGEDKDYKDEEGSYRLTAIERANLKLVCSAFEAVCVVFNCSGIIDTGWIDDADFGGHIKALVYAWEGGQEGGMATARVLMGRAYASGKLTSTIARSLADYPSSSCFANSLENEYREDIYVGYRYFMTFARDKILFPFGFGLSYTTFKLEGMKACLDLAEGKGLEDALIRLSVRVSNIGTAFKGKEVVQLYYEAPQGKLGKACRCLAAFAKTKELAPGASEELELSFPVRDMASYDEAGLTGHYSCLLLEKGNYIIYAGTDSLSALPIPLDGMDSLRISEDIVIEKHEQVLAPQKAFPVLRPLPASDASASPFVPDWTGRARANEVDLQKRIASRLPAELARSTFQGITFDDVKKNPSLLNDFVAQMGVKELSTLARGEGMLSDKVTKGIAAAFGGVSARLHDSFRIPCAGCADGPSGIRMDTGKEARLMPSGTNIACSWNLPLVEELYAFEGQELQSNGIDALLGPGINIQRNPLGGRNFEYFSEDPLLSGLVACAEIAGLRKAGAHAVIKHFAANNQETYRREGDSIISERALREIYLKVFEIAIKKGNARAVMSSYNSVNGHWAASNYELVNTILRREWGFDGLVMTDWWACMNDCVDGGEPSVRNTASMVRSGNNVYMVVDNDGAESNVFGDNIESSLASGMLTIGELQRSAVQVLSFLLSCNVSKRSLGPLKDIPFFPAKGIVLPAGAQRVEDGKAFALELGHRCYIAVAKDACFAIRGEYKKDGDDLSQSAMNILVDGEPAASFQCRTTMGSYIWAIASRVRLGKGLHEISLLDTKPGIRLKNLSFSSGETNPVSLGFFK